MPYALIQNDIVKQIVNTKFLVSPSLKWVDLPQNHSVTVGDIYENGEFSKPAFTEPTKPDNSVEKLLVTVAEYLTDKKTKKDVQDIYDEVKDKLNSKLSISMAKGK